MVICWEFSQSLLSLIILTQVCVDFFMYFLNLIIKFWAWTALYSVIMHKSLPDSPPPPAFFHQYEYNSGKLRASCQLEESCICFLK